jgi:RNA polymerase sigma-54 factor
VTVPASRGVVLRLDAAPKLTLLPLPLLLGRLALLTTPAGDLAAALENLIGEDPLLSVLPPSAASIQDEHLHDEEFWEHLAAPTTLEEHLALQLPLIPEADILGENAAEKLSLCLDGRGYLAAPPEELARMLGVNQKDFEALLLRLRETVEPPGLFAPDLAECLLLQLRRTFPGASDPPLLLRFGREELERRDWHSLQKRLGWEKKRIEEALGILRRLDPHPGSSFCRPHFILPELELRFDRKGTLSVRLLRENLPRLTLDMGMARAATGKTASLPRCTRSALGALAARYRTKLRLGFLLGERQERFLRGEVDTPEPMTLSEAASLSGLAPSTVQRTASSTWASTPRGTRLLAALLARGTAARPDLTVAALRGAIRRGWEEGKSDAALARELGVPPRTVTWHRRELGLPRRKRA